MRDELLGFPTLRVGRGVLRRPQMLPRRVLANVRLEDVRRLPTVVSRLDPTRAALSVLGYTSRDVQTRTGKVRVIESARGGSLPAIVLLHGGSDDIPLRVQGM